jgi:hypothetical protein
LRAWTTTSRLPRIAGHGRGVGAQAPPRRSPAPAHPVLLPLPNTTGGRDGHSRTDGRTPTRTPARTAVQDGHLAWPAGRRERTPRRTATATDRMPDAFLWSSAVVHPCGLAGEYESRTTPVRPGRRSGRVSECGVQLSRAGVSIPTAMVRVMVKRLARQSPSRLCERPAWPHDVIRTGSYLPGFGCWVDSTVGRGHMLRRCAGCGVVTISYRCPATLRWTRPDPRTSR